VIILARSIIAAAQTPNQDSIKTEMSSPQGLGIVALYPFYSCWVGSEGLGVLVASRAWCVRAVVMLVCPAVLEDPDGAQIVAAR
jgi:hypothetical protein